MKLVVTEDPTDRLIISVNVKTDGPAPGTDLYSMLSIGAIAIDSRPGIDFGDRFELSPPFYEELKPISGRFQTEALAISELDRGRLLVRGRPPRQAMKRWDNWIRNRCKQYNKKPLFLGFDASTDWMFTNWYFITYLGHNPFGESALDVRSYYMGKYGITSWDQTDKSRLQPPFNFAPGHTALQDAREQAKSFWRMFEDTGG